MANGQDSAGFGAEPGPAEHAAPPDWLEAARQAFLWRYFHDGCRQSDPRSCGDVRRGGDMKPSRRDAGMNQAA